METLIEIRSVHKRFRRGHQIVHALDDIDTTIGRGEFVCLLGPSGCGKSTLLNMLAGIIAPSSGKLTYENSPLKRPNVGVGYITQDNNLFPWRTVAQNVGIGLEIQGVRKEERQRRVAEAIQLVGLESFEEAHPAQLSGGMKKRAALARTLVLEPELILADEPFGALDAQLKVMMQGEMLRIWRASKQVKTVVFVTHDIGEAITLADRIIVLTGRPGRIKEEVIVDIPRPREPLKIRFDPRYAQLFEKIWGLLETTEEMAEGQNR